MRQLPKLNIERGKPNKGAKVQFICDRCKSPNVIQTWLSEYIAILECNNCGNKGRNVRS